MVSFVLEKVGRQRFGREQVEGDAVRSSLVLGQAAQDHAVDEVGGRIEPVGDERHFGTQQLGQAGGSGQLQVLKMVNAHLDAPRGVLKARLQPQQFGQERKV